MSSPATPNIGTCCSAAATLPVAAIYNPPGLAAIQYRCGTFTSFRRAMLDAVANPDLLAGAVTSLTFNVTPVATQLAILDSTDFPITEPFRIKIGTEYLLVTAGAGTTTWTVTRGSSPSAHSIGDSVTLDPLNPFAGWHEGIDSDYQTMFVELWAYLGDILTFYQERIANEAYLGTATQRDSLLRLAGLIDYRPSPGSGASGLVAFTVPKNQAVTIPAGFRVGSRALPGKPAVTYETATALTAVADNSLLTMAVASPQVPYDPGSIVLAGVKTTLKANDFLLAVEHERRRGEAAYLLQIKSVTPDAASNTTTILWEEMGGNYTQASKHVALYLFAVKAAPLGHIAPRWEFISPLFTNLDFQHTGSFFEQSNWDAPSVFNAQFAGEFRLLVPNPWFYVPTPGEPPNAVFLDGPYDQLNHNAANPGWAALVTDGGMFQILHVSDARPIGKTAYTLSSRSTRLTFEEQVTPLTFPLRTTSVLTGITRLPLQLVLTLPPVMSGDTITLAGIHQQLQSGQTIVLSGKLFDSRTGGASETDASESAVLAGPVQIDTADNITILKLKSPLINQYALATCSLLGNVVEVTQGETVKDEVLGSGTAAAFQSFALKKSPVTYLPSTDPEGLSAVQSTLTVTVNGVEWTEQPNLASSGPTDQDFSTILDDSGETTVVFGDGFHGARPPSGVNNIHARYRKGLGSSGNLPDAAIQLMLDSLPNLQKVANPVPASGGGDAESLTAIRTKAPASLRTFSRAVSAADYAALALSYPGIAKASATWVVADPATGQTVPHPYVQLTAATVDRVPFQGTVLAGKLRRFLDNHRDPNVLLRIQDFTPVYVQVAVEVDIDSHFPHQATLDQVQAGLNPGLNSDGGAGYFAFERLQFGQTVFLSDLYAAIQAIPGVKDATIATLRRVGPGPADPTSTQPHDIVAGPTEIVTVDPVAFPGSSLTVTGQGGFAD